MAGRGKQGKQGQSEIDADPDHDPDPDPSTIPSLAFTFHQPNQSIRFALDQKILLID